MPSVKVPSLPNSIGPSPPAIGKHLFVLGFGRLLVATIVLGSSLLISVQGRAILRIPSNMQVYLLISILYFYSLVCVLLIKRLKDSQWFIFSQILLDTLFTTAFVYISGGVESIFVFLYFFSIIAGALFLDRKKLFIIVAFTTLFLFSVLLKTIPADILFQGNLFYHLWLNRFVVYKLGIHTISLWGVAILTSILSNELQKRKIQLFEKTKAYQSLERFNENVLQSIVSGILTIDPQERIIYVNNAGKRILERDDSSLMNRQIHEVFPALAKHLHTPTTTQEPSHHYTVTYESPDSGTKIIGFSVSTLLESEGKSSGNIIIFQDLTSFKAMERRVNESEKLATVGRFAAALAHEIRNPLTSLSGSIQILRDSLHPEGTDKKLLDIVLRETDRLNRLVSDFLQFSRFGKENFQRVNPYLLIEEIVSVLKKENDDGDIHFSNKLPEDFIIQSDRDRLKQVFWNILTNAVQSKDKPELNIVVKGTLSKKRSSSMSDIQFYTITIQDNGKGIPSSNIERIFEPFFTTRPEGTGLGLSIAYQIVSALGGTLTVHSKEGIGTMFKITLPV